MFKQDYSEVALNYSIVSPYSSVILDVEHQTNYTKAREPLVFRPKYPEPIKVGQPVPY